MSSVAILLAYMAIGMMLARLDRGRAIHAATGSQSQYHRACPNTRRPHKGMGYICRHCVMRDQYLMAFLWPGFALIAFIRGSATKAIDKVDPQVHRRLQERIRELEQEAGIR